MDANLSQTWLQTVSGGGFPLLTVLTLLPTLFALGCLLIPGEQPWAHKALGFTGSLVVLLVALAVFAGVNVAVPGMQLVDDYPWIEAIGARWTLGIDGLSLPYILLTAGLVPLVFAGAWSAIDKRWKEFTIAMLVLETGMIGSLLATDLLVFYVFWEVMLVPMYLIIGIWGGKDRIYATVKFFLYTMFGSLLMLVAILYLYNKGAGTFSLSALTAVQLTDKEQLYMFAAFALAFLIKVPVFPFHTWLPDAHTEAPTPGSVILAGVMLKLGTYGFWRFAVPLFPVQARQYQTFFAALAVIGIVYGALMCLAQRDIKKLIAYSSVSHLGYCMLGIFAFTAEGATGSAYQMLNHGVSTGALFLMFGMLYERRHARLMSDYGGIARIMPVYTAFFLIVTFSSIAVPGTNGFVGEFLVLLGSFKSNLPMAFSVLAATCVVLGAAYMLWMVQKVFFGQVTHPENLQLKDLSKRELAAALPFIALIALMGLRPQPFLDVLNTSTTRFVARSQYAANGEATNDAKVRVLVRQLPRQQLAEAVLPAPQPLPSAQPTMLAKPMPRPVQLMPVQPSLQQAPQPVKANP